MPLRASSGEDPMSCTLATASEIDAAFATMVQQSDWMRCCRRRSAFVRRAQTELRALAARHAMPAIYYGANSPMPAA